MSAESIAADKSTDLRALLAEQADAFAGRLRSLQIWVDDDLGLHPRASIGREVELSDRRLARQCGLTGESQTDAKHRLALPLRLSDRRVGALLAEFDSAPSDRERQRLMAWVDQHQALLDGLLVNERLTRLSGVARRAEALRAALSAAHSLEQIDSLWDGFQTLHQALSRLMTAENFFVVLLDEQREFLVFPYFCDEHDHRWDPISFREGRLQGSMSAIIVAAGRVMRGSSEELLEQAGHGDTADDDYYGPNASDWLGVPLMVGPEVVGAMVVQSYRPGFKFDDVDPGVLSMLAEASAAALYRRRVRETLERLVAERTSELKSARDQAERTLAQLQSTQKQLVMSEKMASLGQLVAGVAHEVNTPLGVALTAASLLQVEADAVARRVQAGRLTRSELHSFVAVAQESSDMAVRNLERAGRLVQSFKQVSVDRAADQRRSFRLDDYLVELLDSLRPMWTSRTINVTLSCQPDLTLESYPGTLGQIISNLIQNALIHAFAQEESGTIDIRARATPSGDIEIDVCDSGCGVPDDIRDKVFEPFFTTRRNRGGTGLGLHIVFNLVTQTLGGEIELSSAAGRGSVFRLRLPQHAPG